METENGAVYLKQVPLFADLADEDLRELIAVAKRRIFRSGEVIFHREDHGQVLYVIKEGKVKISLISPEGQEISLVVFGKGECFGEFAILDGLPRSADAVALERVECYTLQRSDFHKAIMKNPKIAIQVLEVLSKRLRTTDQMIEDPTLLIKTLSAPISIELHYIVSSNSSDEFISSGTLSNHRVPLLLQIKAKRFKREVYYHVGWGFDP